MTDRPPPPHHLRTGPGHTRTGRANLAAAAVGGGGGGVRRNLFQSQLTRRPTPTTTGPSSSSSSAGAGANHHGSSASSGDCSNNNNNNSNNSNKAAAAAAALLRLDVEVLSDTSEIVIRDKNGDFEMGDPPTPPLEDLDEVVLDDAQENERERQKLAETVRHHQINRTPAQPEEVLEALKASMRAQVIALAEDNWMYEPEESPRGQ
ncbi:hypothetical protein F4809DRAFT_641518 [Biscogniauxia mediterranea]|nr:hypothetical protein F4809DRAFT_641518 [Biscogniauxia mediterranea]